MLLTPPPALKMHEPYIRHKSGESTFLVALFLVDQATRFVMGMGHNETVVSLMWSLEPVEYRVKSQTKSPSRPQRTRKSNKGFYWISVR